MVCLVSPRLHPRARPPISRCAPSTEEYLGTALSRIAYISLRALRPHVRDNVPTARFIGFIAATVLATRSATRLVLAREVLPRLSRGGSHQRDRRENVRDEG